MNDTTNQDTPVAWLRVEHNVVPGEANPIYASANPEVAKSWAQSPFTVSVTPLYSSDHLDRMRERAERAEALLDGSEEDRREARLEAIAPPDNGTVEEVLTAVLRCAYAWFPEARIIGNVRAGDIARAVEFALTKLQDTSHE